MSISKQIIFSSSFVALLALFGGYISHRNMHAMEVNVDQCMENAVGLTNALNGVQENILGIQQWFFSPGNEADFRKHMEALDGRIDQLTVIDPAIKSDLRTIQQEYLTLKNQVRDGSGEIFFSELGGTTYRAEQIIQAAQQANSKLIVSQSQGLKKTMSDLNFWLIVICVSMFFLAGIFGQVIARALDKSLKSLEDSAAEILKGNFSSRVNISNNNEFGYLSDSFNLLASSAESAKLIQDQKNEMVRLNNELKLKNDSLDSFVYRVSHDLKAPLINLISLQSVVKKKVEKTGDTGIEKSLEFMSKNTDKLQRTIHDLLEVSRIERSISESKESIKIQDVIDDVVEENNEAFDDENVRLNLDLKVDHLYFTYANLKSIFANLITNSIKYRQENVDPNITIKTKKVNATISLKYKDNGIGIDLDKHGHKLFGIFNRFHNHVEGSGVGLYIVKKIVEESGGSIKIESQVGAGTTFLITLPYNVEAERLREKISIKA